MAQAKKDHSQLSQSVYLHAHMYPGLEFHPGFDHIQKNLGIYITVNMILAVTRFQIICVQMCLDSSTSKLLISLPTGNVQKPEYGVYMTQYVDLYWSTPGRLKFLKTWVRY